MKTCRGCGKRKALGWYTWRKDPRSPNDGYYNAQCNACIAKQKSVRQKRWRAKNPEKWRASKRQSYVRKHGPLKQRYTAKDQSDARKMGATIRWWAFYLVQEARIAEHGSYENFTKARATQYYRDRYANNEEFKQHEIQRSNLGKKKYAKLLRKAGTTGRALKAMRDEAEQCGYCNRRLNGDANVDHIIPISQGGNSKPNNLIAVCQECNISKGDKTLEIWLTNQATHVRDNAIRNVNAVRGL